VSDSSAMLSHQIGLVSDQIQIALGYVLGERKVKPGVVLKDVEDPAIFKRGKVASRIVRYPTVEF
jgi:hypothetical protein